MATGKCFKCDRTIPRDTFRRLCAGCRAENFGLRRPDGKGDPHPSVSEFAETVMLVDARDEVDPDWREGSGEVRQVDPSEPKYDWNDYEFQQGLVELGLRAEGVA